MMYFYNIKTFIVLICTVCILGVSRPYTAFKLAPPGVVESGAVGSEKSIVVRIARQNTVSDYLVSCLESAGVTHIFNVPGSDILKIRWSIKNSGIKLISSLDERWAAYQANVWGRLTRKPGVCLVTLGAGALNALAGVADATLDLVPMVILIGQRASTTPSDDVHQKINIKRIYQICAKRVYTLTKEDLNKERIKDIVTEAFRTAVSPPMGPFAIIIPEDLPSEEIGFVADKPDIITAPYPRPKAQDWPLKVRHIVEMIKKAKYPVIILGSGCSRVDATAEAITALMGDHGIPTTTTLMGKGIVPFDSPWCLPPISGPDDLTARFIRDHCDLVITVGYFGGECDPSFWNQQGDKTIIHINFVEVPSKRVAYTPKIRILADLSITLNAINNDLDEYHTPERLKDIVRGVKGAHDNIIKKAIADKSVPMNPIGVISRLRESLDGDVITICDVGEHKFLIGTYFAVYHPVTHVDFNGLSGMSGSVPGAIAIKLTYPDKRVMAFCGDGGFYMNLSSIATAVQYQLPVVVVVFADGRYGLIERKQIEVFGQDGAFNIDLPDPDKVDLAGAAEKLGAELIRITRPEQINRQFIDKAFDLAETSKGPCVIYVPIDYKLSRRLEAEGTNVSFNILPAKPVAQSKDAIDVSSSQ